MATTTTTATMDHPNVTLLNAFEMHRHRETRVCRSNTCVAERKSRDSVVNSCIAADTCNSCAVNFDLHVDWFDFAVNWGVDSNSNAVNLDMSSDSSGLAANSGYEACSTAENLDANMDSSYHQKCVNWNLFKIFPFLKWNFMTQLSHSQCELQSIDV